MRVHYNKLIQAELRQLRRFKEQAEKRSTPENIARFENKIRELENELTEDTPRFLKYVADQQELSRIQQKHQHDKQLQSQQDAENKEKLDAFYRQENQIRREDRFIKHQMRREYEWLCRQEERLPEYIQTNLQRMPNNKGYIWKGIWYFGHMPAERHNNMVVMFERPLGMSDMLVHEIRPGHSYRILQKNRQGVGKLVSERPISVRH